MRSTEEESMRARLAAIRVLGLGTIGAASALAALFVAAPNDAVAQPDGKNICRATGQPCFLGVDPDIFHMPLSGEIIQSSDRQICATRSGPPPLPPENFT